MKRRLSFLCVFILFHAICYSQGKINEAEDKLKKIKKSNNSSKSQTTFTDNSTDSESHFLNDFVGGFFVQIFAYTAYGIAFESPFEMDNKGHGAFLTKHPYMNSDTGNYSYNWNEDSEIFTTSITNRFIFETNKVYGNHLNVDMKFLKRLGLELDYLQLWEETKFSGNNALAIYTALAKYNRVRTEQFNAWWGLGATYVDGDVNAFGFTYGLGAEFFFIRPFSLESHFNQTLINDNSINKFNGLLNYHKRHYTFTLGFEHLKISSVGFSTFTGGIGISL